MSAGLLVKNGQKAVRKKKENTSWKLDPHEGMRMSKWE